MTSYNNIWNVFEKSYNYIGVYPDLFLIIALLVILTYLIILNYFFKDQIILNKIAFFLTLILLLFLILFIFNDYNFIILSFNSLLIKDLFSSFIKVIIIFLLILLSFLSLDYLYKELIINFEYFVLLLITLIGFFTVLSSYDLLSMYLGIELQSLCFYILATFKQYTNFSSEAGIKYFILGAFSSGILLFGFSLLYGFTGVTDFYSLELLVQTYGLLTEVNNGLTISILFIVVGLLFKLSAAPFHMWAPDVYEGSPTIVTAMFAIIPKIVIITLFSRLLLKIFNQNIYYFNQFLIICAILSLIIGTFGALFQVKLKRMLAYSSISHVGFLLIGLSIHTLESLFSVIFYLLVYILLSLNLFSMLLSIRKWTNFLKFKKIAEVNLLIKSNFFVGIIFCLILFSLGGIPPLLGFYSKLYVFMGALMNKYTLIVIISAIVSVISAMYYIRLIKFMFFNQSKYIVLLEQISYCNALIISLTFLVNFFFLFRPNIFIVYLHTIILNFII